jgi:hypothetical protein
LVKLEDVHLAQALNYLEAYNLEIGMLINFGAKSPADGMVVWQRNYYDHIIRNEKSLFLLVA